MTPRHRADSPLPPLIFGEAIARHTHDVKAMADRTAQTVTSLNYYEAIGSTVAFHSKISTININDLSLTASASTPVTVDVGASSDFHLFVPFAGQSTSQVGRESLKWNAGESAIILPETARGGRNATRSVLLARLDRGRLASTAAAILGSGAGPDLDIDRPRLLALRHGPLDFSALFLRLCSYVDLLASSPAALGKMGIDDVFYRQVVAMLCPQLFLADVDGRRLRRSISASMVDVICEAVRARPDRPLTMTEMERLSGRSERALQYAFMRKFGCTPMEWQRRERLILAREQILRSDGNIRLTDLALDAGFPSLSAFSSRYRAQFGESPSATLARVRRR